MIIEKIINSFNYRKRQVYFRTSVYFWRFITKIFVSDKRDLGKKEALFVMVPVWGEWHINLFFKYTLPSLMQSGNLPNISKTKKVVIYFYTKKQDISLIKNKMESCNSKYEFYIYSESDFKGVRDSLLPHAMVHILKECVNKSALLLLAQPDLIYSNMSVSNLVSLTERKGVNLLIPHPRISYECFKNKYVIGKSLFSNEIDSPSLVSMALACKHKSIALADELLDVNSTMDAIATRELDGNILTVVHNLPSPYLMSPIPSDVRFFNRRNSFNVIDH